MTRRTKRAAETGLLDPDWLFRRLTGAGGIVLAVSGGPDSTALMLLVAGWSARPPTLVATVDHRLRPEAAAEAQLVADNAAKLGLPWRILRAPERNESGNLQDWARRVRYRALATAAEDAGFETLVTAHHRDDQAETFLLRLARGSGVYGLAAMLEEGTVEGLRLVRPLLGLSRHELSEIAAASGLPTVADPSNEDSRFDRVRLRGLLPSLAEYGLTSDRLAETAERLGRAAAALDHYAQALLSNHFRADPFGVVAGPAAPFAEVPEEVGLRALALLLRSAGGADYTPRLDRLEALREALLAKREAGRLKRTLHGVVVSIEAGMLVLRREWGRDGLAAVPAPAGSTLVWDRRFRVVVPSVPGVLSVGPLGNAGRRLRSAAADSATVRALPGLYAGAELLAAPATIAAEDDGDPLSCLSTECLVGRRLGLASASVAPH